MVSTGAADPHNMTIKILDKLLNNNSLSDYTIRVVIGKGFKEEAIKQIRSMALTYPSVVLYENPPKMSEIMLQSDFAITAGGSTIYELFACGVVTFAFIYAENQRDMVEASEENGYLFNLGNYNEMKEDIANRIIEVAKDSSLRKNMVEKIQDVVGCKGTQRIVEEVEKYIMKKCNQ
jgi:spore coat polysaccharide biosynthesis predicted glycosyltransferase SpsG